MDMKYKKIREEELKNKIGVVWFKVSKKAEIWGKIDFAISKSLSKILSKIKINNPHKFTL